MPAWQPPAIGNLLVGATPGSVLFAGASGGFAQDNSNLFWDDTNNRLGIGTNAPTAALDVVGNITSQHGTLSERFGFNASASGVNSLAVGYGAVATGSSSTAIGRAAAAGAGGVALGTGATAGSDSFALGNAASAPSGAFALGPSAVVSTTAYMLLGGANSNWTNVVFGKGETSASPDTIIFQPTDSLGTDVAGANLVLAAGRATGNALGGSVVFRTADVGASGTTLQTARERARFDRDGHLTFSRQSDLQTREVARFDVTMPETTDAIRTGRVVFSVLDFGGTREAFRIESSGAAAMIGFLGANAAVRQTSGANLTNNVTSGGTDDTIDNWTDLTTYATDAAAIRNAIYQLARKVKQLNDGARTLGLFT